MSRGNDFLLQLPVSVGMISKNMFWVGKDLHCLMSLSFIMVLIIRFQIFALGEKKFAWRTAGQCRGVMLAVRCGNS